MSFFFFKTHVLRMVHIFCVHQEVLLLISNNRSPLAYGRCHSAVWLDTSTTLPIIIYISSWHRYQAYTFTKLQWFPLNICDECSIPTRKTNSSKHWVPSYFGFEYDFCTCSDWSFFPNLSGFSRLHTYDIPRYFLEVTLLWDSFDSIWYSFLR